MSTGFSPGFGYWIYSFNDVSLLIQCIKTPPSITITSVEENWNLISNPSALQINQTETIIEYNGTMYNWSAAFAQGIIDLNLFGWNRPAQNYEISSVMKPSEAYWLYSYETCQIERFDL